jgi:hypothetical protein
MLITTRSPNMKNTEMRSGHHTAFPARHAYILGCICQLMKLPYSFKKVSWVRRSGIFFEKDGTEFVE